MFIIVTNLQSLETMSKPAACAIPPTAKAVGLLAVYL